MHTCSTIISDTTQGTPVNHEEDRIVSKRVSTLRRVGRGKEEDMRPDIETNRYSALQSLSEGSWRSRGSQTRGCSYKFAQPGQLGTN